MRHGKVYSAYDDLRTRKGALFFFVLGVVFLVLTLVQFGFHLLSASSDLAGIFFAVTILCFGFGTILYFFSRMFEKLADIAEEIEGDESLRDDSSCEEPPQ